MGWLEIADKLLSIFQDVVICCQEVLIKLVTEYIGLSVYIQIFGNQIVNLCFVFMYTH